MSGSANSVSVAVFGLGYVGAVSAACLARDGHTVIGVDPNPLKVAMINEGRSPVVEPGLPELVAEMVAAGRLRATDDFHEAVAGSDVALICVGTPSRDTGDTDLSHLRAVARQIGDALSDRTTPYTVCVRSTSFPGTTEDEVIPLIEEGRTAVRQRHRGLLQPRVPPRGARCDSTARAGSWSVDQPRRASRSRAVPASRRPRCSPISAAPRCSSTSTTPGAPQGRVRQRGGSAGQAGWTLAR